MPIAGKTTPKDTPIAVDRLGKAWKGDKRSGSGSQTRAGKDLQDRFRLELPAPYDAVIKAQYGTLQPKQLRVFFPFDTTDEVFQTWNDAHTVQGLKHRCDGERIIREVVTVTSYKGGKPYPKRSRVDCDKPCQKKPGEDICNECVSTGYLSFIVRELFGVAGMSKVIAQTVTGITDVIGIINQLRVFESKYGSLRQSPVPSPSTWGFIPFVLSRVPREISRPIYDAQKKAYTGGYTRGLTYPVVVTEDPDWLEHWQRVTQRQQILQMVAAGQQNLLMGEDLQVLQEMSAIALPAAGAPNFELPAAQPQPALPQFEPVDTEAVADEVALAEAEATEEDEAQAYREQQLSRGGRVRVGAVNAVLNLDQEELKTLVPADENLSEREKADLMIMAMLDHWAKHVRQPGLTDDGIAGLLKRLYGQMPLLVDEDLARVFVAEAEHWVGADISNPKAEQVDGFSID